MADAQQLNAVYQQVNQHFIAHGRAPHYTELAGIAGITPDEARAVQHELADTSIAANFVPETDHVESWAPFSNVATPHLITVGGEQRWYAQCGVELFAAPWAFPGQEVRVETRCPDCGETISARLRDGELLELDPPEAVVYMGITFDQFDTPLIDGTYSLEYG